MNDMQEINIKISEIKDSKLTSVDFDNLPFGRTFTDYMLVADYENGSWQNAEIKAYQPLTLAPSLAAIHYGQAIFEGIKAYKSQDGRARIYRPEDNFARFNVSAQRMEMPEVPEELFMGGLKKLIALDQQWIPAKKDYALYIRPFMFATDEMIGVRPSQKYKFMIILSPTGPYYSAPMRIYVEEKYVRAVPGGVGFAKAAGNYGAAMFPTEEAKRKGYDQVLWMDAIEHKYVQECGTMNVFFIIGNKAITPGLSSGTILAGVTRDSVIKLLQEMNIEVEERDLSIDEIVEAHKAGTLQEVFGTGTAVTISMVKELRYKDYVMQFDVDSWSVAPKIKSNMDAIKDGSAEDRFGWMTEIN